MTAQPELVGLTARRMPLAAWRNHPVATDVAVTVGVAALSTVSVLAHDDRRWRVWLICSLLVLPLVWRRLYPTPVFTVLAAVALVQWALDVPLVADTALLVALYTVAAHEERTRWIAAAVVLEGGVVLASFRFPPSRTGTLESFVFVTGLVAAALFLGTTVRARRDYLSALVDLAHRLERDRDQQAQLAATSERTRIAREMHDVVAHSLSVMIALADGAAAISSSDQSQAGDAMRQVGSTGRQALGEMRRLLGVLHDPTPADLAPQPTITRVPELIDDVRDTGLPVDLVTIGQPQPLPFTAEATAYRIVQESLTNVLKHGKDVHSVQVTIDWREPGLTIEVFDDGRTSRDPGQAGHGLQGMRERVALFDGKFAAGPTSGGWRVRAHLRPNSPMTPSGVA